MTELNIVVIGTSAGGVEALKALVANLPADLHAAVFIVLHVSREGTSVLPEILNRVGPLPSMHPQSGQKIEHGHIYIAPNDHHMLIKNGTVTLSSGPRENGFRPAIDVLFRTAAQNYGENVIGVIMTGMLDNGVGGLISVKDAGGIAIVQDPTDAAFPSMPEHALNVVDADYVLPLSQIGSCIVSLVNERTPNGDHHESDPTAVDPEVENEESLMNPLSDSAETGDAAHIYHSSNGTISDLTCPECGGVLVEYQDGEYDNHVSFKCRVGHAYSLESMFTVHSEATEEALWAAVRSLEENVSLCHRMAQYAVEFNDPLTRQRYEEKARDGERHANTLRQVLLGNRHKLDR